MRAREVHIHVRGGAAYFGRHCEWGVDNGLVSLDEVSCLNTDSSMMLGFCVGSRQDQLLDDFSSRIIISVDVRPSIGLHLTVLQSYISVWGHWESNSIE